MSKHGSTKEKILRQISQGSDNLSEISEALDLAPSTVSKHIHDLESAGVIEQKDDSHVKKWKYYQLKSGALARRAGRKMMMNKSVLATSLTLVVMAIIAFAAYGYNQNAAYNGAYTYNNKTAYIPISITDPPQVPSGTTALYINYSHLKVHVVNNGGSKWVSINASGRLDLMSLLNESQVIGTVGINLNSSIEAIRFNITAANITIDNVTYPVYLAVGSVTAKVSSVARLNESSSVLLDFSPVVMPAYARNTTLFVLVPTLSAAIVPRPEASRLTGVINASSKGNATPSIMGMHERYPLPDNYREMLPDINLNLSIVNATLHSSDNVTSLKVVLENNGVENVTVMGVTLYGNLTPYPIPMHIVTKNIASTNMSNMPESGYGSGFGGGTAEAAIPLANDSGTSGAAGKSDMPKFPGRSGSDFAIDASAMWARNGTNTTDTWLPEPVNNASNMSISDMGRGFGSVLGYDSMPGRFSYNSMPDRFMMMSMGISFMVEKNGTLALPYPPFAYGLRDSKPGYLLQAHSTSALSYNGVLRVFDTSSPVTFTNRTAYRLVVVTNEGIVQANFTST